MLEVGRQQGNLCLAITNAPNSPLAHAADFVLDIQAGPELATAATKSYTCELMAIAMLSAALDPDEARWSELEQVGGWVREALELDSQIAQVAQRYRYMQQCVVLGRGYNYATAFEWALKLKELTYLIAEPYSSADFQHGPLAMVGPGFPVFAIAARGAVLGSMLELLETLRRSLSAELLVISNSTSALALAHTPLRLPEDMPEWLTPLVSIVPAQLLTYYLTLAKGYDPDHPRSIHKVTETE